MQAKSLSLSSNLKLNNADTTNPRTSNAFNVPRPSNTTILIFFVASYNNKCNSSQ
ncbi:hypothetical protein JHK82_041015 [Glycine max]|uniref:Uncharacterized protein n=2 Tax=Glycine subgen. Soja TaxID=1462606 RepID=A0A0R0G578_SOYBN|nr:hypothetical protein JHK87_040959 [Glycine soja]KAG4947840.1 hypothetical protein JHK86_041079 [Glycine max]KAG5104045.1 hypothetical protein JHK82_041015 [Glycine max]KAG5115172.1 hypothetical protein JHK84_041285 [Glycine max]KAH1144840.1 hypothetical protein GYH30_040930 [Glycine max]